MLYAGKADLGVLLDHIQLVSALEKRFRIEYLPFYAAAAQKTGANLIFFSDRSLLGNDGLVQAYSWNPETETYQVGLYEIPPVIHNRLILTKEAAAELQSLFHPEQTILYNGVTRFDKWEIHQILSQNPETLKYLPKTAQFDSNRQMKTWLQRHADIYLKPCNGSLSRGVIRLRHLVHQIEVSRTVNGSSCHRMVSQDNLSALRKNMGNRPYLIQEGIALLKLSGKPVDFRVAVQKGASGDWEVTGTVARVGTRNAHATNLAVGGTAVEAKKVLKSGFGKPKAKRLYGEMQEAAVQIARQIERIGPNIADLGLDLAVGRDGTVKFIEANGRDLRITFRDAKQNEMWESTFQNPIFYGAYLMTQGRQKDEESLVRQNAENDPGHPDDR